MMKKVEAYDCIIVGGGHNGLVCAAYLAKAGKRVCVLERRSVLGGACTTEELWPGFRVSTAAYVISLFSPRIIRDLKLTENGLRIFPRDPSSFTPLPDGRHLILGPDAHRNQREIAKFSARDATEFLRYESFLGRIAKSLEPIIEGRAPNIPFLGKISARKLLRDARIFWNLYKNVRSLGHELPEAIELLTGAARPILERWFESEPLKATLATDAIIGAFASPSSPGSAYVLLHHVMGEAGGARGVWGYVRGGMGGLASALEKTCKDLGVTIVRDATVRRIFVFRNEATGVLLENGQDLSARCVASSIDAYHTFFHLVGEQELPLDFSEAIRRIDYSSASAKINLALSEQPRFICMTNERNVSHLNGTIHIGPTLDYIERAYDDAKYGNASDRPVLEITLPSIVDPTLAPVGQHVMSMFVQYVPYKLKTGPWDETKRETFGDSCVNLLGKYAPNVPGSVLHRQVLLPHDIERIYGLRGGNIFQGAMSTHQLFSFRPVAGFADYTTPIKNLYLCGAATHPGGGVMGICGRNAAEEILRTNPV